MRRNRVACALALLALLAALGGMATFVLGQRALQRRATELQAVTTFQTGMLEQIVPEDVGAHLHSALSDALHAYAPSDEAGAAAAARIDYTGLAVDMLDEAVLKRSVKTVRKSFADQPLVQAQLLQTLADSYRDLGMLDVAEPILQQAMKLFRNTLGVGDPQTLASMRDQLELVQERGNARDLLEGEARHREVLRLHIRYLGNDSVDTALARDALGQWLMEHGKAAEAEKLLRAAAASIEHSRGHDDRDAVAARADLAYAIEAQGNLAEAVPYFRSSIADMSNAYGPDHRDTLVQEADLAYVLDRLGQTKQAEALLRKVYEKYRASLGADHQLTLICLNSLAATMAHGGDWAGAEPLEKRAFDGLQRVVGPDHAFTLNAQMALANTYRHLGKLDDARALLTDVIGRWKPRGDRRAMAKCQRWLGQTLQAMGKLGLAEQALKQSWQTAQSIKRTDEQRKTAQALVSLYSGPHGDATKRAHWADTLRNLSASAGVPTKQDQSGS